MNAKKCDRCGEYYTPTKIQFLYTVNKYNHPYPDTEVDLCYNCSYELEKWIEGKANGKDL